MIGKKSGECGGWGKPLWPSPFNFWRVGCAMCSHALSWRRTGPFLLTTAGCKVLQVSVHLINLLSMLLRYNGFTGIQNAVVDPTVSRLPVTMTFFWCKFGFGKCALELLLSPASELAIASYCIKSTIHPVPQSNQEMVRCSCIE